MIWMLADGQHHLKYKTMSDMVADSGTAALLSMPDECGLIHTVAVTGVMRSQITALIYSNSRITHPFILSLTNQAVGVK